MSDLTIEEMKEKINRVNQDIDTIQSQGAAGRKLEVLTEYKAYLEDEMAFMQREQRSAK